MLSLATTSYVYFLLLLEKKIKGQISESEMRAKLDKRIERARARHEFSRLVIGIIFLVVLINKCNTCL